MTQVRELPKYQILCGKFHATFFFPKYSFILILVQAFSLKRLPINDYQLKRAKGFSAIADKEYTVLFFRLLKA